MVYFQCTFCDITSKSFDDKRFETCRQNGHQIIKMLSNADANTKQEKKKSIKKVKGTIGSYFVESIVVDSKPYFLCYNTTTCKLELKEEIEYLDVQYIPFEPQECGYPPYFYSKEEIEQLLSVELTKEELLDEIKSQIDRFINAREIDKYLILGDLFLSYCQEWISTLHFPFFVGETESGKSSCLHLFKKLGYRCLYGEDIPNADVYNFLGIDEEATGMIAEDEAQNLDENKEKLRTYKNSYSRGSVKARIITTASSKKQVFYKTFCLKAFAGERVPQDKGFLERLALVHMVEGETKGNIKRLGKEEETELKNLRNKLLVWKVQNITKDIQRVDSGLKQRDQELWEDFLCIAYGTKYFEKCKNVVAVYVGQRHQAIKNSLEAKIFELSIRLLDQKLECDALLLWQKIIENFSGNLEESKGTFYSDDYGKITKNLLSRLLQDKFQATKQTRFLKEESKYHKQTYYSFKLEVLQRLAHKYDIALPLSSSIYSGSSGQSDSTENTLDRIDNLDHYKEVRNDVPD